MCYRASDRDLLVPGLILKASVNHVSEEVLRDLARAARIGSLHDDGHLAARSAALSRSRGAGKGRGLQILSLPRWVRIPVHSSMGIFEFCERHLPRKLSFLKLDPTAEIPAFQLSKMYSDVIFKF